MLTPQLFSLAACSGLNSMSHWLAGSLPPSALVARSVLMPMVLMPQKYGTANLLPGSNLVISFISSGSRSL
ncbi:hypothetical protein D3C85_1924280 [compost metagenome]